MTSWKTNCILAVDGGGTRCRFALVGDGVSFRGEVGAANVTTDFTGAVQQLNAGLEDLANKAGVPLIDLENVPGYLGLAGYQADRDAARLAEALPMKTIKIDDDRPSALIGALGANDGALIHSGTGSFFGVQKSRKIKFSGGWGSVLGDLGSAAWLGKSALAQVLNAEDGMREKTGLTRALMTKFNSPSGILQFAAAATPSQFGDLAPMVMSYADDPVAKELLETAASHFEFNLHSLGWGGAMPVCLSGGLAPYLRPYLTDDVATNLIESEGSPLDGAIALAFRFAEEGQFAC